MKKIIEGKLYNTETAIFIGEFEDGEYSDTARIQESLYKTSRGVYFLAGEGGMSSKYAKPVGSDGLTNGSNIFLLTKEEAYLWAEKNLTPDVVLAEFPDMVEEA